MYYIYHVPGVKVGCTTQPGRRLKVQKQKEYQLLEAYEDIYEASDREIYLQKLMGYPVDTIPYWKSVENRVLATEASKIKNTGSKRSDELKKRLSDIKKNTVACKDEFGTIIHVTREEFYLDSSLVGITANIAQPKLYKKVRCIEDNIIFKSLTEASEYYGISDSNIIKNLQGNLLKLGKRTLGRIVNFEYIK
jgi:hypothetical protein